MYIGDLEIGHVPRVVSVIHGEEPVHLAKMSVKAGADILELRIDKLKKIDKNFVIQTLQEIKKISNLPVISTIRSKAESDTKYKFELSESERLDLYKKILPITDAVDIELSSKEIIDELVEVAHSIKKVVIISYHNFKETPSSSILKKIVDESEKRKADIIKISVSAQKREDVSRLMTFAFKYSKKQIITISMGSIGVISRIIAPLFGSCITYGFIGETPVAKGQINIKQLKEYLMVFYSGDIQAPSPFF